MNNASNDIRRSCEMCGGSFSALETTPIELIRESLQRVIREQCPNVDAHGFVCDHDLQKIRSLHVQRILQDELGEISELDASVVKSLHEHELISSSLDLEQDMQRTMGERLSDQMASFGGSWRFILCFAAFMFIWISWNQSAARAFDPYPFILLNLFLSCLAAIQAPIIMMSQNRQEAKDRERSKYDYQVNLKAELEIRQLHEKLDHLLNTQWQRLVEIQQVQLELLEGLHSEKSSPRP